MENANAGASVGGDTAGPRRRRRAVRCGRDNCDGRFTADAAKRCWLTWLVMPLPMFSTVLEILVEGGGWPRAPGRAEWYGVMTGAMDGWPGWRGNAECGGWGLLLFGLDGRSTDWENCGAGCIAEGGRDCCWMLLFRMVTEGID